ncbi:M20 family metallo-hydrolase [Chryseobacterium balustinum]|uniref:Acetylornithine deacetylase n=1 Tax=Chryseobacterium balustinum TaxID=246 RepID=A0AAX2IQP9_9FLAO|nr:M20 family metallo-hydrolase [Chryseobacterium balustinum]AZB29503.1 M20/M25/M40 family metallo-hydrolase [Chryseobacterium balustinum]SKB74167.1 acetylornithine deacetylase [Chryseobacterium balustinum]SQA92077.1 Succinyl-diaminopimelate desuccinylase [Chryseobacterium balustinum]
MQELKSVYSKEELLNNAVDLLKKLIEIPSFSKDEYNTSVEIENFFKKNNIPTKRFKNNIWAVNKNFDVFKPSILLNTHHDTVKPNKAYTLDPFLPIEKDGKLFGLGSNDAGASLVSMAQVFLHFFDKEDLQYNLIIALTAEEEISGFDGIEALFSQLPNIELAIVGEPTQMNLAIAEKGLLVIDGEMKGTPSHAAHPNDDNSIVKCMEDLQQILNFKFPKVSDYLGEVKVTLSGIHAGVQHNVVPESCVFTLDVRVTDEYSNQEAFEIIQAQMKSTLTARSFRLNSSKIEMDHPFVQAGLEIGRTTYCSPTSSDQAIIPCTSVKIGPGDSTRSHTADEYIYIKEIEEGIAIYIEILEKVL